MPISGGAQQRKRTVNKFNVFLKTMSATTTTMS
jgi:hypothetical protein